jgi:hypothetical protein
MRRPVNFSLERVIEARDQDGISLYFFASESIPWHARSLKNLQRLMPSLTIRLT